MIGPRTSMWAGGLISGRSYRPAPPAAVGILTTPTCLRRPIHLLYPIEPGLPDPSASGGARGASLPLVQLPLMRAAVLLTPLPSPSGWLLPPPSLTVRRPWRRARCGGLPPLALRVPPGAGHRCTPRDRPLAARPGRHHCRRRPRGQPGCEAKPPLSRSRECARRAWCQSRHGRGRSLPYHWRDTSACRRREGDLWRAAALRRQLQQRQRQRRRRGRAQRFCRAPAQGPPGCDRSAQRRGADTTATPRRPRLLTHRSGTVGRYRRPPCPPPPPHPPQPPGAPRTCVAAGRRQRRLMASPPRPPAVHRGRARRLAGAPPAAPVAGRGGAAPPGPAAGRSHPTRRDSRRPIVRRIFFRAPRCCRRSVASPAADTVAVTAAATAAAPPPMQRHSRCGGGGGDRGAGGYRMRMAPPPQTATLRLRTSGRRARLYNAKRTAPPSRTLPQVRCAFSTTPLPGARPWPPSETQGGHAARCSVGGGVGGGTPRRAVASQWGA